MKFLGGISGAGLGGAALGAIGAGVLALGGYIGWTMLRASAPPPPVATSSTTPASTTPAPVPQDQPVPQTAPADIPTADSQGDVPEVPAPIVPSLDLVRVEADGSAVIAGLAAPGAKVHVLLDGSAAMTVEADVRGNFVALMEIGLSDRPRVLSLLAEDGSGARLASLDSAIIEPVVQIAEATPAPALVPGQIRDQAQDTAGDRPETVAVPATSAAPGATPAQSPAQESPQTPLAPDRSPTAPAPTSGTAQLSGNAAEPAQAQPASRPVSPPGAQTQPETAPEPAPAQGPLASAPPASPATQPAQVPQPAAMAGGPHQPDPRAGLQAPTTPSALPGAAPAPISPPAPPRVMIAGPEGITVVQSGGRGPDALTSVTLDAITYDAAGEVQLSGRGARQGSVRLYLDNRPILTTEITEDGQWRTGLPEVESGIYTLRVDQLRPDGSVASRIETPFKREDSEQLASVAADVAASAASSTRQTTAPVRAITVQPGSTLWQIATDTYGEGVLYVRVFEANRDQIRDPDLIYPGQVFTLPQ